MTKKQKERRTLIRKWIKALRSGKYKQTAGRLCKLKDGKPVGYCCLGVACEIYAKNHRLKIDDYPEVREYNGSSSFLPIVLKGALGLVSSMGSFRHYSLTEKNDKGSRFTTIANIIERNLKDNRDGLFLKGAI